MLARGEPIGVVLQSFLGTCSAGRAAQLAWLSFLRTLPTLHSRRMVLEHFLRTFEHAQRHGAQWRAIDRRAFVGHQHELVPKLVESMNAETGELELVELVDALVRRHCPAARAGGLSARQGRSPRQLNRYRAELRGARVMASKQPPYDASDAVRPRRPDGSWAYAQHWLVLPPTPEMLTRWRGRAAAAPRHDPPDCGDRCGAPRADDLWALRELVDANLSGPRTRLG